VSEISELAEKLGKAIASSDQAAKLRQARAELDKHPDVKQLLEEYGQQAQKVSQLESQNKPVEVEDKHALRDLHGKLIASDVFKQFTAAQVEYVDVMRQVSDTLRGQLAETEGAPQG